jgi:hypothetical protein
VLGVYGVYVFKGADGVMQLAAQLIELIQGSAVSNRKHWPRKQLLMSLVKDALSSMCNSTNVRLVHWLSGTCTFWVVVVAVISWVRKGCCSDFWLCFM